MVKIKYPFDSFDLERACVFFSEHNIGCYVDDLIELWSDSKISLCYRFKSGIEATDRDGNIENINGFIYPEYKQIMDYINEEYSIIDMPLRVRNAQGKAYYIDYESFLSYSTRDGDYLAFNAKGDLRITDDEMSKVYEIFSGDSVTKIHMNSERHTKNREQLYMQAIRVLIDHPDECKGKRGALTQEAWTAAIIAHFPDYGYPGIGHEDTITGLLSKAMHITNTRK